MDIRKLGALATVAALVLGACSSTATTAPPAGGSAAPSTGAASAGAGTGTVISIGSELPLSGGEAPNGEPTLNGVKLAISDINAAGGINGATLKVNSQDDAVNGVNNPQQGAKNITTLVNDASVVGVVGPFNSAVAKAEIPISNAAGLLQCSPANTNPGLTKTWGGVDPKTYRPTNPDKIAYVRVATTDDIQGLAAAQIAYNDLNKRTAYIVDDTTTYGKGLADVFEQDFKQLGGTVVGHDSAGSNVTDYTSLLTAAQAKNPDVVFFGGVTTGGGGLLRRQMAQLGMANIPFIGGDGISDGSAATASSFLNIAGPQGDANTWMTVAAVHDIPNAAAFAAEYQKAYGKEPGAYSAAAYACTQIIADAIKAVGPDREKVRAYITGGQSFDTVLGTVKFDSTGDTNQRIISIFQFDASLNGGDWKFVKQVDFGNP